MDFVLNLEYSPCIPLYRRLSDALRKAILDGRLTAGDTMPSVRDLVVSLGVSRATVLRAFDDLKKQGYLESSHGRGTFVKGKLPGDLSGWLSERADGQSRRSERKSVHFSRFGQRLIDHQAGSRQASVHLPAINYGGAPLALTPLSKWKQLLLAYCRSSDLAAPAYKVEPFGYPPLREALAAYLHRTRAVNCQAEQVAVFSSKQLRLDILARVLINPGDCVAFEEPGYPEARQVLSSHGARIVPVPVDGQGLCVDYLASHPEKFKLVYVTPSHQDPTGAVLSLERRRQLLAWAGQTGTFIIEDDYDSEYRYGSKPLPSLQRLDNCDLVIYMSSPWKILFQVLRMGYLVVPERLRPAIYLAKMGVERHMPLIEQLALTDFINGGHLELHIKRTQSVYAKRRQALIYALTRYFGRSIRIMPESAGMHILAQMETGLSDGEVESLAAAAGISLLSTAPYYFNQPAKGEFMVPFAGIDENEISERARRLARLVTTGGAGQ